MNPTTLVIGHGTVGRLVTRILAERGDDVRVAQRTRPAHLPDHVGHTPCDVQDPASVAHAAAGASQILLAISFPYDSRVWRTGWPHAMRNVLDAAARTGARIVFIDNLYQLGPQHAPRHEDMPLATTGTKPAILAEVTRLWMAARNRVRFASLRCSDFYGPGVANSHIGATGFARLAVGKPALLLAPPDTPHDFAYVPDIARAAITLLDAPDDAYGQSWNMPCAPTRTPREILRLGTDVLGVPLRLNAVPLRALPALGLFWRPAKEVADVAFTWDRPYLVDSTKFQGRFWSDVTPFETGAPATIRSFK
jgi:nucleoside-diphosphate-sugar epimerase